MARGDLEQGEHDGAAEPVLAAAADGARDAAAGRDVFDGGEARAVVAGDGVTLQGELLVEQVEPRRHAL